MIVKLRADEKLSDPNIRICSTWKKSGMDTFFCPNL